MRKFLLNFMDATDVDKLEEAYKTKNPDAQGLPTYIPKTRLDEEIGKRKSVEDSLKAIPADWKEQLEKSKKDLDDQKNNYENQIASIKTEAERTIKVYGSGARNAKAVMALLEKDKPIDTQLEALKKSDPYLFNVENVGGKGTGKDGGDDGGKNTEKLSEDAMYRAVGLVPPTHN